MSYGVPIKYYRAVDSLGRHHRVSSARDYTCCLIIRPKPFDTLFTQIQVEWYGSREQCQRHLAEWAGLNYPVETAPAEPITEREYRLIKPPGISAIRPTLANGGIDAV